MAMEDIVGLYLKTLRKWNQF